MAIWQAKFISFDGDTSYAGRLTLEDQGNGHATGKLYHLTGPVPVDEIDLSGSVHGNQFTVGGSVMSLGVYLSLTFTPFVFAFTGGARFIDHETKQDTYLFVITQGVE